MISLMYCIILSSALLLLRKFPKTLGNYYTRWNLGKTFQKVDAFWEVALSASPILEKFPKILGNLEKTFGNYWLFAQAFALKICVGRSV